MAMPPVASVVIPAHNEARVIEACLTSILAGSEPGELEIVVACNGCTDGTEELAAAVSPDVRVVTTDEASKWGALNLGDRTATVFPRMYVDADVIVSHRAIQALAAEMGRVRAMAGAPVLRLPTEGQSWPVRAWFDTYQHCGYFEQPFVGQGFYAISEEGRSRFGEFPASGSDDLLIMETFAPHERVVAEDAWFEPALPKTLPDLYNIRVRQLMSNELRAAAVGDSGLTAGELESDPSWLVDRLKNPATIAPSLVYIAMKPITLLHAKYKARKADEFVWTRDSSSH